MEARKKRFEDLNITRDEINNIGKALQQDEFRKLFVEYCEEVTNPENKKQYQLEVRELEKQRGVDVTFINPEPGFVVKSSIDGERKAFINISKNDQVDKPSSSAASEAGTQGRRWSLPFSLAPPREDYDKCRNPCTVFDVVFHSETHKLADKSAEFRQMLINTALDAVQDNCKVKLDRINLKFPKMTYKGLPQAAVIRRKIPNYQAAENNTEFLDQVPYPTEDNLWTKLQEEKTPVKKRDTLVKKTEEHNGYTQPKYSIKYRHGVDLSDFTNDPSSRLNATVPKALVISIDLPLLKSAKDLSLDVSHKSLNLQSEKPKYKLDLVLPYGVDENEGNASFDVSSRKLSIEVPIKITTPSLIDVGREDSGVESDPGSRPDEDSDEKSPSDRSENGHDHSDPISLNELSIEGSQDYTSSKHDSLLKNDVACMLPNYSWNTFDDMVAVVLHVKNVESNSMKQSVISDERGIQLSFSSLGGGLFPQSFSFCMAFPGDVFVVPGTLTVEIWDNNVVAQFGVTPAGSQITQVLVGTEPNDLQERDLTNLTAIEQKIADLQEMTEKTISQVPLVEVHTADEDELVLKIEPFDIKEKGSEVVNTVSATEPNFMAVPAQSNIEAQSANPEKGRRNAIRQISECTSDDRDGKKIRGILKKRPLRSLSESNADDYAFYQSTSFSDESGPSSLMGSTLCIGEGGSETGCDTENEGGDRQRKKSVRFSDVVAKRTFRPHSSILGQKKKNQRKQRNKKRAQERRASESENSEPDELDKARRRAVHSEGEISDLEEKSRSKFLKELKVDQNIPSTPQAKKILRRANSSDTDDEAKVQSETVNSSGDTKASVLPLQSSLIHGESSEDERDNKTEDKKKKKKKKKGKKMSDAEMSKTASKPECSDFKNDFILELEL